MNVLGVGAHFDDPELGCSGALIKHVQKGDQVQDLGDFLFELEDVELWPLGAQLKDVRDFRYFPVGDHDGVTDLFPHIDGLY